MYNNKDEFLHKCVSSSFRCNTSNILLETNLFRSSVYHITLLITFTGLILGIQQVFTFLHTMDQIECSLHVCLR